MVLGRKIIKVHCLFIGPLFNHFSVVLLPESTVEDWIVDAGLEKDLSHIVIATGHNALLRCQTLDLAECCRSLLEHMSEVESKTPHHLFSNSSLGTQEAESIDLVHRVKEAGRIGYLAVMEDGRIDASSVKEDGRHGDLVMTDIDGDDNLAVKEHGKTSTLAVKEEEQGDGLVTKEDRSSSLSVAKDGRIDDQTVKERVRNNVFAMMKERRDSAVRKDGKGSVLTVAVRVACVERCVLFSGHLVMMSGCWEGAVMLAGTMALQVMVWAPWGPRNSDGNALPLHCLWGHQVNEVTQFYFFD